MSGEFENILNFRDVGATVNGFLDQNVLKEGILYRSARPDDATVGDRKKLKEDYNVKTVIDLRTKTEHLKQAQKRQADLKVPALLQSNAALAEPVQVPGLRYLEIKVTGKSFENHLVSQLSWSSYFKLISRYLTGHRTEAIRIISQEVMLPRGLIGMGIDTLDHSGSEIAEALHTLTSQSSLPLLIHCTQGKDRTGLLVAVILLIAGVPIDAITHDYLLTKSGLNAAPAAEKARLAEIAEIGLTPAWGECPSDFVEQIVDHLHKRYGGIDGYCDKIGFREGERKILRQVLAG